MVTVQGPHDTDPREHRRSTEIGDEDQRLHRSLPIRGLVLGLGKLRDVLASILQGDEWATAWQ